MPETRRRIGAHHIDIALAAGIEEMRARAPRQDNRKRHIIVRAEASFARNNALRGQRALQGHGGLLRKFCHYRMLPLLDVWHENRRHCPGNWHVFEQIIRDKAPFAHENAPAPLVRGHAAAIVYERGVLATSEKSMAHRQRIDEMDLKILNRLQLDARISNVHLAEAVHLSPSACLERVKSLEKDGLIRRYIADFDLPKISSTVMLFVEVILENHREADFERFLAAIRKRDEVLECFKIGGRIDYLMRVLCRDIDHY